MTTSWIEKNLSNNPFIYLENGEYSFKDFFELLIDKLIKIVDPLIMNLIIKEIATYNYIINKSYRDIVSIESLFIRLYRIINYEKLL